MVQHDAHDLAQAIVDWSRVKIYPNANQQHITWSRVGIYPNANQQLYTFIPICMLDKMNCEQEHQFNSGLSNCLFGNTSDIPFMRKTE